MKMSRNTTVDRSPTIPSHTSNSPFPIRWRPGEVFWQNIGAYFANPTARAMALIEVWIALAKNVLLLNQPTTGQNQLNRVLFDRWVWGVNVLLLNQPTNRVMFDRWAWFQLNRVMFDRWVWFQLNRVMFDRWGVVGST